MYLVMENHRNMQSAYFDLVNTYFGIDVVHNYDGIYVTAYISETMVYDRHHRVVHVYFCIG